VVAAPDAEDDPPPTGQNVGHRVILGEAERMPHGQDVEAAAEINILGDAAQVHCHHQDIGIVSMCDHVRRLMAEGRWTPRYETFPI
jgi:hypothetical protein